MKGFIEYASEHGQPTPWEYAEASAIGACFVGMPLIVGTDGKLAKAGATDSPTFIAMTQETVAAGDKIPVVAVLPGRKYITRATANIASPVRGTKYTIAAGGDGITATTASGVAALDSWDGDTIKLGDEIIVRL